MHSICFNAPCYLLSESALIIPDSANFLQVGGIIETNMEKGLQNYGKEGYKGVTETWNIVQHEVRKSFIFTILFLHCSPLVEMLWCSRIFGLGKHDFRRRVQVCARFLLFVRRRRLRKRHPLYGSRSSPQNHPPQRLLVRAQGSHWGKCGRSGRNWRGHCCHSSK